MSPSGLIYLAALAAVFLLAVWVSREPGAPKPDWMPIDWWPFDSRSDAVEAAAIEDQRAAKARSGSVPWRQRRSADWRGGQTHRAWAKRTGADRGRS